jgi:hypothetical protein
MRPVENCLCDEGRSDFPTQALWAGVDHSGATAPDFHRLPRFAMASTKNNGCPPADVKKSLCQGARLLAPDSAYFKDHGRNQIPVDYEIPDVSLHVFVNWLRQGKAHDCSSMRGNQACILQLVHEFSGHRKADFRQDAIVQLCASGRCMKQVFRYSAFYQAEEFLVLVVEGSTGKVEMRN